MVSSSTTTLLFESGIMKISDYDPIHNCYLTRTLQLPSLPLFSTFDLPFFETTPKLKTSMEKSPLSCSRSAPVNSDNKRKTATTSRFIEHFEIAVATSTPSPLSHYYPSSSTTLRSSRSTSSKKTAHSLSNKAPRRCYSNPNLSKKIDMTIEPLDPTLLIDLASTSRKAPKRSLSNAFHVLSGLIPIKSKRRLNNRHDQSKDGDSLSRISTSSSSSTIRMAWQGTTWLDEMKTSSDFGPRQRLASIDRTTPWWTATAPLSNDNVCVNA